MKASIAQALKHLPGAPAAAYPEGVPFATVMAHGSMSVEVFAPGSNADGRTGSSRTRRTSCTWCTAAAASW